MEEKKSTEKGHTGANYKIMGIHQRVRDIYDNLKGNSYKLINQQILKSSIKHRN